MGIGDAVAVRQRGITQASDSEDESITNPITPSSFLKVTAPEQILSLFCPKQLPWNLWTKDSVSLLEQGLPCISVPKPAPRTAPQPPTPARVTNESLHSACAPVAVMSGTADQIRPIMEDSDIPSSGQGVAGNTPQTEDLLKQRQLLLLYFFNAFGTPETVPLVLELEVLEVEVILFIASTLDWACVTGMIACSPCANLTRPIQPRGCSMMCVKGSH